MLFFIFLGIWVLAVSLHTLCKKKEWEFGNTCCEIFAGLSGICVTFSLVIILVMNVDAHDEIAKEQQTYNSLAYRIELLKDSKDDAAKDKLISDIKEYNVDIINGKQDQRDFWIGIYNPNIYDDFKIIDYKQIK